MNTATSTITTSIGPPGVEIERISASALEAIASLLPGERGLPFFSLLLSYAEAKQLVIDDGTSVPIAKVSLSLESFARRHGLSKDTVLRYVAILQALQIVKRRRGELHIPLVEWRPTHEILTALDKLIGEARRKLQQLAASVKSRFLLLYGTCSKRETFLDEISATLLDIQNYFSRSLGRAKRALLVRRVAHLSEKVEQIQKGDFSLDPNILGLITSKKGDFPGTGALLWSSSLNQKGDRLEEQASSLRQKGDFSRRETHQGSSNMQQKGDPSSNNLVLESSHQHQKGDFLEAKALEMSSSLHQKGDRNADLTTSGVQKGDFSPQSLLDVSQKGDFLGAASPVIVNVNDSISLLNDSRRGNDNVNDFGGDKRLVEAPYPKKLASVVGSELADFLDGGQNIGGYVEKCKKATPTQVRAAVIASLVHTHFPGVDPQNDKGRPKIKGAWFHDFCNQYLRGVPIQPYVRKWTQTDLSWQKIDEALLAARGRYTRYLFADSESALLVRKWLWGEIEQAELEQALNLDEHSQMQETAVPTSPPKQAKDWMSQEEAEALATQIKMDAARFAPKGVQAVPDDRGNFVVQLRLVGAPLTMKTRQAWQEYWTKNEPALIAWEERRK